MSASYESPELSEACDLYAEVDRLREALRDVQAFCDRMVQFTSIVGDAEEQAIARVYSNRVATVLAWPDWRSNERH